MLMYCRVHWTVQDGRIVQFDELYDSYVVAEAFRD